MFCLVKLLLPCSIFYILYFNLKSNYEPKSIHANHVTLAMFEIIISLKIGKDIYKPCVAVAVLQTPL